MKVGVVGPGAVGSYYGARLSRDGHEVHLLLRSDYEHVRRNGVTVLSPDGDFNARPKCARRPEEIGAVDLVLVAIKTTGNHVLRDLLPPLLHESTAVLTLQNGLGNEEFISQFIRKEQILGGLCFVCLNRVAPGVIHHLAHGKIELGEFERWPEPRTHDIASAFRHAGVPCSVRENLEKAHWEKLVWNIPFNGLGVASCAGYEACITGEFSGLKKECLTTDRLLAEDHWLSLVRELMHEVISSGNAFGLKISEALAQELIDKTKIMAAYKPSTLVDFERGLPVELDSLFLEPLRRAETKGVRTPRLRALSGVLTALSDSRP